tara:strand:+ start:1018 stop:1416 length:399 start_codon:yes stop_codon:yes gene_type:complete
VQLRKVQLPAAIRQAEARRRDLVFDRSHPAGPELSHDVELLRHQEDPLKVRSVEPQEVLMQRIWKDRAVGFIAVEHTRVLHVGEPIVAVPGRTSRGGGRQPISLAAACDCTAVAIREATLPYEDHIHLVQCG